MIYTAEKPSRRSHTKGPQLRRPRSFVATFEAVEDRKLMSTLSAVTWNSGGQQHSAVYGIGFNNSVSVSKDGGAFVSEGGYVTAISAGRDAAGNPEVYGIGGNGAVFSNDNGAGWVNRGGTALAISASVDNTVFAIGTNNAAFINRGGTTWTSLGGYVTAISAGVDGAGNPEVYGIGGGNAVFSSDNGAGWVNRGGTALAISASVDNTVFAIGTNHAVFINRSGTAWTDVGGYALAISAGSDTAGNPEVDAIGTNNAAFVSDNGAGFVSIGGYVTEISGTGQGTIYVRGSDVDSVFVSRSAAPFTFVGNIPLADPAAATAYSPAPAGVALFNNNQPSYLDMAQGAADDCWLDASLAEVAARDPQDIKNMFVYDGTTVGNGATVGLYSVRFFSTTGTAFYVQVDTELPSGGGYYNHPENPMGTQVLWTALAEKGYAEANALGLVTTGAEDQGCYSALNYGSPTWALQAITGKPANEYAINPTNIASAWNAGQLVVLCTSSPTSSLIVGDHCYALVGYNASSSLPFEIYNPWGTQSNGYAGGDTGTIYGLFNANATFVSQNFTSQGIGTGATTVNDLAQSTGSTTLDKVGPTKFAIVHGNGNGNGNGNTAVSYTRPAVGMATVGGPFSLVRRDQGWQVKTG